MYARGGSTPPARTIEKTSEPLKYQRFGGFSICTQSSKYTEKCTNLLRFTFIPIDERRGNRGIHLGYEHIQILAEEIRVPCPTSLPPPNGVIGKNVWLKGTSFGSARIPCADTEFDPADIDVVTVGDAERLARAAVHISGSTLTFAGDESDGRNHQRNHACLCSIRN